MVNFTNAIIFHTVVTSRINIIELHVTLMLSSPLLQMIQSGTRASTLIKKKTKYIYPQTKVKDLETLLGVTIYCSGFWVRMVVKPNRSLIFYPQLFHIQSGARERASARMQTCLPSVQTTELIYLIGIKF